MQSKEEFNVWIEKFLQEKGIDKYEVFTIKRGEQTHIFEIGHVIEMMKITTYQEQEAIREMLIKIDQLNENIRDYIKHLANALIDTYNNVKTEESEGETM